jgi:biopolymer transport protein ExbD
LSSSASAPAGKKKAPGLTKHRSMGAAHRKKKAIPSVKADINVTPLVDVMLVLLIIFMVVTPMLTRGKDVPLPKAKYFIAEKDSGNQIIVSVDQDGSLYLGKDYVGFVSVEGAHTQTLTDRLTQQLRDDSSVPIVIKADQRLHYKLVREVFEAVHDAGAEEIGMATDEDKGS